MTKMISLTKYEHQVVPKFRDQLNQAESVEDVKKFFIATTQELLSLATEGSLSVDYDDISLLPGQTPSYSLSSQVTDDASFKELANSDLDAVMGRLSEQASNHHKHLMKNNTKTKLKIKNH